MNFIKKYVIFSVFLTMCFCDCVNITSVNNFHLSNSKEEMERQQLKEAACLKSKTCVAGGPKICGYDEYIPYLALFSDACTMFKASCKGIGQFNTIDLKVCESRVEYRSTDKNDTLHLRVMFNSFRQHVSRKHEKRKPLLDINNLKSGHLPARVRLVLKNDD